jgi:hypothetical protein
MNIKQKLGKFLEIQISGFLIKIKKGIYKYTPKNVEEKDLNNFNQKQKNEILKRDSYKCVICGKGEKEGEELHVDHIKPKDKGGKATIENGQTLCSRHNMLKKNLEQTETGKKMFIRLNRLAQEEGDKILLDFSYDILQVYEKYGINGHIIWGKK